MYHYLLFSALSVFQTFDKISFEMQRRVNTQGKTVNSLATVYFNADGDMVTQYAPPLAMFIFNNRDGEISIYNEKDNTVIQSVNYTAGTRNTNFYYFLQGEMEDLGLHSLGFVLKDTRLDDGLVVTNWDAPMHLRQAFASVELVHKDDLPVFLGHKNKKGDLVKKVYFYDFEELSDYIKFPTSITEVEYIENDSTISKTNFSNFQFDAAVDQSYFDFEIPADAKVIK